MGRRPRCTARRRGICPRATMTSGRPDIAVLGGGMAGLAAAWRLTDPHHRDRIGKRDRLPTWLAPGRQGGEPPRRPRPHRGARAPHLARLLRQRLSHDPRVLRRARSPDDRPDQRDPDVARRVRTCAAHRAGGPPRRRLAHLDRVVPDQRSAPRRTDRRIRHRSAAHGRRVPCSFAGLDAGLPRVIGRRGRGRGSRARRRAGRRTERYIGCSTV